MRGEGSRCPAHDPAEPTKHVAVYASETTNAGIASNSPLWQDAKGFEYGIKTEFFNQRLSITADQFQLAEQNVAAPNPLFNTGQSTVTTLLSNEKNQGAELSATGGITPNLSILLGGTVMHLRDFAGRRIRDIPDNLLNVLLDYHFTTGPLKNASAFVGMLHSGSSPGENSPNLGYTPLGVPQQVGFYIRGWTVFNAGLSYRWDRYRFNLNVDNMLNDHFWWQSSTRASANPYPWATVRGGVTIHFN